MSYRNQSTDLLPKSIDWFLYDIGLRHERVNLIPSYILDALVVNVLFFSSKQIDAADDMNSIKNNIL